MQIEAYTVLVLAPETGDHGMTKKLEISIFILLLGLGASNGFAFCKWTDADGVTHYAESCPDNAESTEVQIDPAPSPEQVEEAATRSREASDRTRARNEQRQQEKESKTSESEAAESSRRGGLEICAEARWNLETLRMQRPVYYDDKNQLQFNRSLFDLYYTGQRTYIDDQQRQAEIAHYTQVEDLNCTAEEADIRERIEIYHKKAQDLICLRMKSDLENMQIANTGIPSDKMRELAELISTHCD